MNGGYTGNTPIFYVSLSGQLKIKKQPRIVDMAILIFMRK